MAKIGIVCAIEDELAPYLAALENVTVSKGAMVAFHSGTLAGVEVVALFCGVCKVNAAIATQALIDRHGVEAVVVSGTAGGIDPRLKVGDSVVATEVCYHDVARGILTEYHPWMAEECFCADKTLLGLCRSATQKLEAGGKPRVYYGKIATGEAFIDTEGREEIIRAHNPLCVDMETAAVAHVCYANGVPFAAVRSITDTQAESGEEAFSDNCNFAAGRSFAIVATLLAEIKTARQGNHTINR